MTATLHPSACVEWTGYVGNHGYGVRSVAGRPTLVHRHSYETNVGPIPAGMCVCHRCDNRRCIEPSHLFLGSIEENTADMVKKNRQARGERHSQAKLSADDVIAIRQEKATGAAQRDIAKRYHVSMGTVSMIVNNKIWRSTISTLRRN